jgi:hypothetical protein
MRVERKYLKCHQQNAAVRIIIVRELERGKTLFQSVKIFVFDLNEKWRNEWSEREIMEICHQHTILIFNLTRSLQNKKQPE